MENKNRICNCDKHYITITELRQLSNRELLGLYMMVEEEINMRDEV